MRVLRLGLRGLAIALACTLAACASSIPDISSFQKATAALARASSGAIGASADELSLYQRLLADSKQADDAEDAEMVQATVVYLKTMQATRDAAMTGMVEYAQSLSNVAKAGQDQIDAITLSREKAEAAINAVESAATVAGAIAAGLPSAAVPLVAEGAKIFIDAVARAREAIAVSRTNAALRELVEPQIKAVSEIAKALQAEMQYAREKVRFLEMPVRTDIRHAESGSDLERMIASLLVRRSRLLQASLAGPDADRERALGLFVENEAAISATREATLVMNQRIDEWAARINAVSELADAAGKSAKEWAKTHESLAQALEENAALDADELKAAIEELQKWVDRIKDFRDQVRAEARR